MKKVLAILLAVLMLVSLAACGNKTTPDSNQGNTPNQPSNPSQGEQNNPPAQGDDGPSGPTAPKEAGYYDPDFDYTQYPKYKVAFLSTTAGETWDVFDVAYAHWAERMNIDYTHIWAPSTYSIDEFLSGLETFIDQGYDGIIMEPSTGVVRAAQILDQAGVPWVTGLAVPRDDTTNEMIHPAIGFDNYESGKMILDRLVQWKEETWPDVPWEKVGLLCLDFSWSFEIHQRVLGMEERWAELFPEFGEYNPDTSINPKNVFIGDIATATNPDQTAAQNLTTQQLSNPGDIEVWLVGTPADLYSQGAANAAALMNMTDRVCTACQGGSVLPIGWDQGVDDAWRFALYTPQGLTGELVIAQLWAYMSGTATPDTIYQDWVNVNDHGGDGHSYAFIMTPLQFLERDTYKQYLEWTDLYTYGEGEPGVWNYEPVTDINLYSARAEVPAFYKG